MQFDPEYKSAGNFNFSTKTAFLIEIKNLRVCINDARNTVVINMCWSSEQGLSSDGALKLKEYQLSSYIALSCLVGEGVA